MCNTMKNAAQPTGEIPKAVYVVVDGFPKPHDIATHGDLPGVELFKLYIGQNQRLQITAPPGGFCLLYDAGALRVLRGAVPQDLRHYFERQGLLFRKAREPPDPSLFRW
jgi:hypothetical protein